MGCNFSIFVCSLIPQTQLAELREQLLVANALASSASEEATQQLGARVEALLAEGRELRSQLAEAEAAKTRALDDCRSSEQQARAIIHSLLLIYPDNLVHF